MSATSEREAREFAELTATAVADMLASVGADGPALRPIIEFDVDCGIAFMNVEVPSGNSRRV